MIIVVGNHKGGTSKSTLAVNLAVEYQHKGRKVIILETDPTVSTASQWAADRENTTREPITTVRKTGRLGSTIDDLAAAYDIVIIDTAGKDSTELRSAAHGQIYSLYPPAPPSLIWMPPGFSCLGWTKRAI